MSLNETPSANRIHIGFYGKRNSGKSSLINAFTGQQVAIVSDVAGTTTDPVYKPMEVHGIGPCVFIDTAGVDDVGELGKMRVEKTEKAAEKTDIAVLLFFGEEYQAELEWFHYFKEKHTPTLCVLSKADTLTDSDSIAAQLKEETKQEILVISSKSKEDIEKFFSKMIQATKKTDRQGTSQAVSEKIAGQVLSEHIRVADTYRKLERKAIHHHMNVCNAPHQEKDTDF